MKKIYILLTTLLIMAITGCGGDNTTTAGTETSSPVFLAGIQESGGASAITPVDDSGCIVDYINGQIYGLAPGINSLDGYVNVASGYELSYMPTPNGFGTGTVVKVTNAGTTVASYTIIIFGDVNGDGNIDSSDAGMIVDYENYLLAFTRAQLRAGDVNGDGNLDSSDAGIIVDYENYMLCINQSTGTASSWSGTIQFGSTESDTANGVAVDAGGNIYVTGPTRGGLDGNTNAGYSDIFLVKYNASGTKQWTRQLGTASYESGNGVAVDAGGNIYVTGWTTGSLDGNTNAGYSDMFLVKYNASGTKQWTRQLGTAYYDYGWGVAVDASGNIYVTGSTSGNLDGNTNAGSTDMFLVKYNASGTKQWTRQLGSSSFDCGYGVAVDAGGNIYVTGDTSGDLDGNTNAGSPDMFLVKYNASGTKQWTRQLGAAYYESGGRVAVDAGGNIYVAGSTEGGLDGNTHAEYLDMFLVKYNASGTKQWTRELGTGTFDWGYYYDVAVDAGGNIYVTSSTYGNLDGNTNAGSTDMFLVKYNASGTKQWTRQLGSSSFDCGLGVAVDTSGNIYVTGWTSGDLDGNTNTGDEDMFLVKYDPNGVKQ